MKRSARIPQSQCFWRRTRRAFWRRSIIRLHLCRSARSNLGEDAECGRSRGGVRGGVCGGAARTVLVEVEGSKWPLRAWREDSFLAASFCAMAFAAASSRVRAVSVCDECEPLRLEAATSTKEVRFMPAMVDWDSCLRSWCQRAMASRFSFSFWVRDKATAALPCIRGSESDAMEDSRLGESRLGDPRVDGVSTVVSVWDAPREYVCGWLGVCGPTREGMVEISSVMSERASEEAGECSHS